MQKKKKKKKKFKISASTWNEKFDWPDGSFSIFRYWVSLQKAHRKYW